MLRDVTLPAPSRPAPLRLNLAALTEAELLTLLGQAGLQARLPELSQARLRQVPLLGGEVPQQWPPLEVFPAASPGATPAQTRVLAGWHAALLEAGAEAEGVAEWQAEQMRIYRLEPDIAVLVRWQEHSLASPEPTTELLTWLRDQASGLSGVLTTTAAHLPAPAYSEEMAVQLQPELALPEHWPRLLAEHRQSVQRLGRGQKLGPGGGWGALEQLYALNLRAWQRRGVVVKG